MVRRTEKFQYQRLFVRVQARTYGSVRGAVSNDRPYRECAEHVRQLEGESPFHNLMEVK